MDFPKPPGVNNRAKPQDTEVHDPRLTDDEFTYIFDQHLLPSHRKDTRVLAFILQYIKVRVATQAARDVGLEPSRGTYLRSRPDVHACISAITEKAVMKYGYDAHEIIERVKEVVDVDPVEFENPDGSFKTHLSLVSPEARRAVRKFKCKNIFGEDANGMRIVIGQLIEVELYDKLKGVELLGPEKEIFKKTTKVEHDITNNMAAVLLESKRLADHRMVSMHEEREALPMPVGDSNESQSTEPSGDTQT